MYIGVIPLQKLCFVMIQSSLSFFRTRGLSWCQQTLNTTRSLEGRRWAVCVCRREGCGTCLKLIRVAYVSVQVIFEKEEVDSLKSFAEPSLLLLGFKPKERLKPHYYTKPANFIYPDESVSGSRFIHWKQYRTPTTCSLARLHTTYVLHYLGDHCNKVCTVS